MNSILNDAPMIVIVIIYGFMILTALLWIFLPFAIFGMKPRIDKLNKTLDDIRAELIKNKNKI